MFYGSRKRRRKVWSILAILFFYFISFFCCPRTHTQRRRKMLKNFLDWKVAYGFSAGGQFFFTFKYHRARSSRNINQHKIHSVARYSSIGDWKSISRNMPLLWPSKLFCSPLTTHNSQLAKCVTEKRNYGHGNSVYLINMLSENNPQQPNTKTLFSLSLFAFLCFIYVTPPFTVWKMSQTFFSAYQRRWQWVWQPIFFCSIYWKCATFWKKYSILYQKIQEITKIL